MATPTPRPALLEALGRTGVPSAPVRPLFARTRAAVAMAQHLKAALFGGMKFRINAHPSPVSPVTSALSAFASGLRNAIRAGYQAAVALAIALTLGLTLPATPAAAAPAPPVNLGAASLTLTLRLWYWDGSTWEAASVDDLTVDDLGTGEYTIDGLPTASGDERYTLQVASSVAPAAALAEYTYGAVPGQRIVWRQEVELPPQPLTFKRNDTYGSVSVVIRRRLPAAACEPETTVVFTLINQATSAVAVDAATAELSDCELDATTSTYGATLTYDWQAGDLAAAGSYLGEFTVCYALGSCHTLPADNRLLLRVLPDFDGE